MWFVDCVWVSSVPCGTSFSMKREALQLKSFVVEITCSACCSLVSAREGCVLLVHGGWSDPKGWLYPPRSAAFLCLLPEGHKYHHVTFCRQRPPCSPIAQWINKSKYFHRMPAVSMDLLYDSYTSGHLVCKPSGPLCYPETEIQGEIVMDCEVKVKKGTQMRSGKKNM